MSNIVLHWPQLTFLALTFLDVGVCSARYGEQKPDCYDIVDVLVGPAIVLGLLYMGGFFTGGQP